MNLGGDINIQSVIFCPCFPKTLVLLSSKIHLFHPDKSYNSLSLSTLKSKFKTSSKYHLNQIWVRIEVPGNSFSNYWVRKCSRKNKLFVCLFFCLVRVKVEVDEECIKFSFEENGKKKANHLLCERRRGKEKGTCTYIYKHLQVAWQEIEQVST